jgi:phospholipase/carboxylesterase
LNLIHTLYQPAGPGPFPAILTLHGRGANSFDLLGLAPYLGDGRFMLICPQGPIETAIGADAVGYSWYPLSMGGPPDVDAILSAQEKLSEFIDQCLQRYPIAAKKLALLGFSQGGVMAYSLALPNSERFAALAVLSSWLPRELLPRIQVQDRVQSLPTLIQHGTQDSMIDIARARESVELARQLRLPLTYREYAMGHEIGAASLSELSRWLEKNVGATGRPPLQK